MLLAQQSGPQPAPSLFKQASQKLLEGAQKRVIQTVNQKLQAQPQTATPTNAAYPFPNSAPPAVTVPAAPGVRQAPPCRSWIAQRPEACLLCIHGLGLQSNSYDYFAKETSKQDADTMARPRRGISVYAIDVRGFGSWMKAKGKEKVNFDDCLLDIKQTLEAIRAANPGLPVYLLGESMGGAIALRAAATYPNLVDGLISSVPASERFNQGKTSMKVFMNLLAGFNVMDVGNSVVNQATQNQALRNQWQNDPLSRLNLSAEELIQFQDFMNNNHEFARKLASIPVLFVQGTGDQLVKPEGTWELFNDVASKDKSFFAVPGEHLIFEEAQTQEAKARDQNFRLIAAWLSTKVGFRGSRGGSGVAGGAGQDRVGGAFNRMPINTQGLEIPAQMIENGQYANAIGELQRIMPTRPNDPNVLALMGRAYRQSGQRQLGSQYIRQAMRMMSGGQQSQALNDYLLSTTVSPPVSSVDGTLTIPAGGSTYGAMVNPLQPSMNGGFSNAQGKAKVYAFYASWAEQCKNMNDALSQLSTKYGNNFDTTLVNIEDAGSESIADKFGVGPIPTVVFVMPDGRVGSTIIGDTSYASYERALKSVAPIR